MCHSVVQRKLLLGVVFFCTLDRFRVIYLGGTSYIGRRLRRPDDPPDEVVLRTLEDDLPAEELFDQARLLECRRRFKESLAVYESVVRRYPHTAAAQGAEECIERLRVKAAKNPGT